MLIKDYNNNGYIVLDTNLIDNSNFNNLVNQINDCLKTELKKLFKKNGWFYNGKFEY